MKSQDDVVDFSAIINLKSNIDKKRLDYNLIKNQNFRLLNSAKRGNGSTYFKIPENFIKVGEFQHIPREALSLN